MDARYFLSLRSIDPSCHPVIATATYTVATSTKSTSKTGFIPVNIASLWEEFELAHKPQSSPQVVTATPSVSDQDVIAIVNEEAKVKLGMAGGHVVCSASDEGGQEDGDEDDEEEQSDEWEEWDRLMAEVVTDGSSQEGSTVCRDQNAISAAVLVTPATPTESSFTNQISPTFDVAAIWAELEAATKLASARSGRDEDEDGDQEDDWEECDRLIKVIEFENVNLNPEER